MAALIGMTARGAAVKAYRRGSDPTQAIAAIMAEATPALVETMTAGHLRGEARVILNTPSLRRRVQLDRSPLGKIIESLAEKLKHTPQYVAGIKGRYEAPARQAVAVATEDVVAQVRAAIERSVAENLHIDAGTALIQEAFETAGVTNAANYQLEAIFRTGTGIGYGAGRWSKNQDPEIREILWGYEYATAGDSRVRPEHEALDGLRMPVTDPRWAQVFPPWDWNCRCDVIEIFKDDTSAASLSVPIGAFDDLGSGSSSPFGSALQWAG